VDNGSTDATPYVLQELLPLYPGCRSIRVDRNQGYGYGILEGLRAARGDILGWTHADMQTDPKDVLVGIRLFESNGQPLFVKGMRYGRPFMDVLFTVGMSVFETVLLRKRLWDINAQPTLFTRCFYESWSTPPHDFSLDLYAYYMAKKQAVKIQRFPVQFGERAHGVSHWNINYAAKIKFIRRTVYYSLKLLNGLS
jgi:glycosyltransferase involved in cell wall biosynthesis